MEEEPLGALVSTIIVCAVEGYRAWLQNPTGFGEGRTKGHTRGTRQGQGWGPAAAAIAASHRLPADNHSSQDPSKEGSGCFVALSSLGFCSSPPRSGEAGAIGANAICKSSLIQPFLLAPRLVPMGPTSVRQLLLLLAAVREASISASHALPLWNLHGCPEKSVALHVPIFQMRKLRQGD